MKAEKRHIKKAIADSKRQLKKFEAHIGRIYGLGMVKGGVVESYTKSKIKEFKTRVEELERRLRLL